MVVTGRQCTLRWINTCALPVVNYFRCYTEKVVPCPHFCLVIIIVRNIPPVALTNPNPYYHPSKLNTNSTFCEVASPCILSLSLPLSLNTIICFHSHFSKLIARSLEQKTCYCHRLVGCVFVFFLLSRIAHNICHNADQRYTSCKYVFESMDYFN